MENFEKNIDDLFRDALGDYAETPPPAVWSALEQKLGQAPRPEPGGAGQRHFWDAALLLLLSVTAPLAKLIRKNPWFTAACLVALLSIPAVKLLTGNGPENKTTTANQPAAVISNVEKPAVTAPAGPNVQSEATTNPGKTQLASGKFADKNDQQETPGKPKDNNNSNKIIPAAAKHEKNKHAAEGRHKTRKQTWTPSNTRAVAERDLPAKRAYGQSKSEQVDKEQELTDQTGNDNRANPAPEEAVKEKTTTKQPEKEVKPVAKNSSVPTLKMQNNKDPKPSFRRFAAGIKLGFETGLDNDAARKAVVSPYIEYNISPRWALMTQPAYKYGAFATRRIGSARSYYKENNDSTSVQTGPSAPVYGLDGSLYFYLTPFHYMQTHDSIAKSSVIGGSYSEFELPLLAKFRLSKAFSVFGGVNLVYSRSVAIREKTDVTYRIQRVYDSLEASGMPNPAAIATSRIITYSGNDISQYPGPQYPSATTTQWRAGYMLGFSYEFEKRWMLDALLQQANTNQHVVAGYNVNNTLSAPYLRLTLGYKLIR